MRMWKYAEMKLWHKSNGEKILNRFIMLDGQWQRTSLDNIILINKANQLKKKMDNILLELFFFNLENLKPMHFIVRNLEKTTSCK